MFDFPGGIGPVECVNVEHEEVVLMPRWVKAKRVTFKYGLGAEFIDVLKTLNKLGLDKTEPVNVKGVRVSPRDVVAACLPDPAFLGDAMHGSTCAGLWVTGTGKDGKPREVYLYHVVDNQETMREYGAQCVVCRPRSILLLPWSCSRRAPGRVRRARTRSFRRRPFLYLLEMTTGSPWDSPSFGTKFEVAAQPPSISLCESLTHAHGRSLPSKQASFPATNSRGGTRRSAEG